jgi:hypothetical protein
MTIHLQVKDQLASMGSGGEATINLSEGRRALTCVLVEYNPLGVSFNELRLATDELAGASVADLQRIGESLSRRLTYLLEPISPIEVDAQSCTLQLRSNPPQKDDDGRSYYELVVRRGGELALHRYRKANGTTREIVPAMVTGEVLVRLVSDFSAVLD